METFAKVFERVKNELIEKKQAVDEEHNEVCNYSGLYLLNAIDREKVKEKEE